MSENNLQVHVSGTAHFLHPKPTGAVLPEFPAGIYHLVFSKALGFYLDLTSNFSMPKKMYGGVKTRTDRILTTYENRTGTTGILLTGEKGSGKTLLAKNVANEAIAHNIPTILIDKPYEGSAFFDFLQSITQPCIVLIDEFEKVYDNEAQERLLSMLDGVYSSKKLFLLTANKSRDITTYLVNRPSRIYYHFHYETIDLEFVREYAVDNLLSLKYLEQLCSITSIYKNLNFDMLQSIVEEMNRYQESPTESILWLNAKPPTHETHYDYIWVQADTQETRTGTWHGNPTISNMIRISFRTEEVDSDGDRIYEQKEFCPSELISLVDGTYTYKCIDEGDTLKLTEVKRVNHSAIQTFSRLEQFGE